MHGPPSTTIDLAQARADAAAILEQRKRALGAVVELAERMERKVRGLPVAHVGSLARREADVTGSPHGSCGR
jgi:hypothetical protein